MLRAGTSSTDGQNELHIWIEQALTQHTLADHPSRTKEKDIHVSILHSHLGRRNKRRCIGVTAFVSFAAWLPFSAVTIFLAGFQIRYSMETIEARNTFLYVPFHFRLGTNIVDTVGFGTGDVVKPGDELVAVNGRAFTGAAVYHQELRAARRYLDAASRLSDVEGARAVLNRPFRVTIRSGSETRTVDVYFPHCTCGSLSFFWMVWYCVIPPAVCVLAGLIVVALRSTMMRWLFLAAAISLSQAALVPSDFSGFSQSANPMEWRAGFRIPAIVYQSFFTASWPAWLLLLAVYSSRRDARLSIAWLAVTPIFFVACLKSLIAVAWSENFKAGASLQDGLGVVSLETTVVTLVGAAFVTWSLGHTWRIVASVLTVSAMAVLYSPLPAATFLTPRIVLEFFTLAIILLVVIAHWNTRGFVRTLSLLFLIVPFLYSSISTFWGLWWMPPVPQFALGSLYVGLAGFLWRTWRDKPILA